MKAIRCNIHSNQQVSERYWHMSVDVSHLHEPIFPGQFFNIKCSDELDPFLRRPFSIFRLQEHTAEFLYLVKGDGTRKLTELRANDTIDIFGPLGQGFSLKKEHQNLLLIGRGVGIATLAALAQEAVQQNKVVHAILSARSKNDLLAVETLKRLGIEIYPVTEEDGNSGMDQVKSLVKTLIQTYSLEAAYTCGSKRISKMMQEVVMEENIFAEIALEEHMGCAMGVCYACACDVVKDNKTETVRICREGPVFPLESVVIA